MGRHGGINILHQKSWHVWRMDNRLRVERDEQQHAAEEAEKRRAGEQAIFDKKLKKLRRRAAGEPEEIDEDPVPLASSSSSAGVQNERSEKNKTNEYKGSYGVTLANLKQAEAHLDLTLKRNGKGKGNGKGKELPDSRKGTGGLGSGPHINFFEDAEQEQQRHLAEHEKQLRYTEVNNDIFGKSKRALFSEFDEISSTVPWYLQPRKTSGAHGLEDVAEPGNCNGQNEAANQGMLALRNASRSRSRTPPKRKKWTTSHGQTVLQVKPDRHEVHAKASLKDEKEELQPIDDIKEFGGAQPTSHEIGSSDSDAVHSPVDPALASIGVVLCKTKGSRERKQKKEKKSLKKDKKARKERKELKEDRKRIELESLRKQRLERERAERARVVSLLSGIC